MWLARFAASELRERSDRTINTSSQLKATVVILVFNRAIHCRANESFMEGPALWTGMHAASRESHWVKVEAQRSALMPLATNFHIRAG